MQDIGGPTVARVRAWFSGGPMFQRLDKAGRPRGRLSTVSVRAIIQRRAAEAGIEGRVSGHSLRGVGIVVVLSVATVPREALSKALLGAVRDGGSRFQRSWGR